MIFHLLLTQVFSFEYLSAIVHSQDVSPVPHRELWHPHLYLAKDSSGENYEIRHSSQFYDVSISFLQTSDDDSAPGVMNCECRFVKEEVEEEEETTFLQVMTPSKVKPKIEQKDKEISIGAYVPKVKDFEYYNDAKSADQSNFIQSGKYVNEEGREQYPRGVDYKGPEIIVVQSYPDMKQFGQPVYTNSYTSGYQQPVGYPQTTFPTQNSYTPPPQPIQYQSPSYSTQGTTQGYGPGYQQVTYTNQMPPQQTSYVNQPVYSQAPPQSPPQMAQPTQHYPQSGSYTQSQGYSQGPAYIQGQGFMQEVPQQTPTYYPQYSSQSNYVQQPVMVPGFTSGQYVQEYPVGQAQYQPGFLQTKY